MREAMLQWRAARRGLVHRASPARRVAAARRAVALRRTDRSVPALAGSLVTLGDSLLAAERFAEAEAAGREALTLWGERAGAGRADAWHVVARALNRQGRLDEAYEAAEAAAEDYRTDPRSGQPWQAGRQAAALYTLSVICENLGRLDEAVRAAQRSMDVMDTVPWWRLRATMHTRWRVECHLAGLLSRVGRDEEAVAMGAGALVSLDVFGRFYPAFIGPLRAQLLVLLAHSHTRLGHFDAALKVAGRAVGGFRALGERYREGVAWALEAEADTLTALGRHGEADATRSEAVRLYTSLYDADPDQYREPLWQAAGGRADALWHAGEREKSVHDAIEALPLMRQFANEDPDTYRPRLARTLAVVAGRAGQLQCPEAVDLSDEALRIARDCAHDGSYQPLLGRCLHNRALVLSDPGRGREAIDPAAEAVVIRRSLAETDPAEYGEDLLASLFLLAGEQMQLDQDEQAARHWREAADLLRRTPNNLAHRQRLADVLHNLAQSLGAMHHHRDAIDAVTESIEMRRRLQETDPRPDRQAAIGRALRRRAFDRSAIRLHEQARTDIDEAVTVFAQLAEQDPDRYLRELTRTQDQAQRQRARAAEDAAE